MHRPADSCQPTPGVNSPRSASCRPQCEAASMCMNLCASVSFSPAIKQELRGADVPVATQLVVSLVP